MIQTPVIVLCHTIPAMIVDLPFEERRFVALRKVGDVLAMAGCSRCGRKFFTPAKFARDALSTERYLVEKFDGHQCHPNIRRKWVE